MTESLESNTIRPLRSEGDRNFHIPLIQKKMNKIEQNMKIYSHTEKSQTSDIRHLKDD